MIDSNIKKAGASKRDARDQSKLKLKTRIAVLKLIDEKEGNRKR